MSQNVCQWCGKYHTPEVACPSPPVAKESFSNTPLIFVQQQEDGKILTAINRNVDADYRAYGLVVCDIVRHVANAFAVQEYAVWEWVEKERMNPTTPITEVKPS